MAETTAPLVWDFYREVGPVDNPGGVVHYYDAQAQSLYLHEGYSTQITEVNEGHWSDSVFDSELDILASNTTDLSLDHPANGTVYFSACNGSTLAFRRYVYAMDVSALMDNWSWGGQTDNPIAQFSGAMYNIGADIFTIESTLFQPGSRIILGIRMGNSNVYPIGIAWMDECTYDITSATVDISGRNSVGYYLKDQTFDDLYEFTGVSSDIMEQILIYAGIKKYNIQVCTGLLPFTFKPSDSILDGIQTMLSAYTNPANSWKLVELPDGTICVGFEDWLATYYPNTHYSFNEGKDVFKRKTNKLADSSYTKIRVTGIDAVDEPLTPVTVAVSNFQYWSLGTHKTKHLTAPDGLTQVELQAWAEAQAAKYQYIGIGEDFTGPFRPQLLVGDVAEVVNGEIGTSLGLITEVTHSFSKKDGFKTAFSVDSGGVATEGADYVIYSRAAEVSGYNRKQKIIDLIRYVSKK